MLVLVSFGLLEHTRIIHDIDDLQTTICPSGIDPFHVIRVLMPGSKLEQSKLLHITPNDRPLDASVELSEKFLQSLSNKPKLPLWKFKTPEEAHDCIRRIVSAARARLELVEDEDYESPDHYLPEYAPQR